jgi:hypothetical protein
MMDRLYKTSSVYACAMLTGSLLYFPGSVQAATVFAASDGNVNFLLADLPGATLAMFDDSDQSYLGPSINIPLPSIVGVFGPVNGNNDFLATNSLSNTLTLTGSNHFILGLSTDGGANWITESSVTSVGANAYTLTFNNIGSLLMVDVNKVPAVPVPAAFWLFGSGLLALVGIARRKAVFQ